MRNKPHFCSILSGDIQFYLDFKRAIGRKFNTEEATLRLFDRFIFDYPVIDSTDLTPLLIESFLTSRVRSRPRSYNHLLGVLRCFDGYSRQINVFSGTGKAATSYLSAPPLPL